MYANTERYKSSSIPYMQRLLNDDNRKRKREMDDLSIELSKPKKKETHKQFSKYASELCQ